MTFSSRFEHESFHPTFQHNLNQFAKQLSQFDMQSCWFSTNFISHLKSGSLTVRRKCNQILGHRKNVLNSTWIRSYPQIRKIWFQENNDLFLSSRIPGAEACLNTAAHIDTSARKTSWSFKKKTTWETAIHRTRQHSFFAVFSRSLTVLHLSRHEKKHLETQKSHYSKGAKINVHVAQGWH